MFLEIESWMYDVQCIEELLALEDRKLLALLPGFGGAMKVYMVGHDL